MFDLERVHFSINNEFYDIDFSLFHNINILIGKSGSNKTNFATCISNIVSTFGDIFTSGYDSKREKCKYNTRVILSGSAVDLERYENGRYFIIIDDVRVYYMDKVISMLKRNSELIFLLIDRGSECSVNNKYSVRNLQCFYDAVFYSDYNRVENKRYFRLKSYVSDLDNVSIRDSGLENSFDCCIIEGSKLKSEYQFYKNFFGDVIASSGKSVIADKLSCIQDKQKPIIVIIDLCGIGEELCRIITELKFLDNAYIMDILSFEYSLVSSRVSFIRNKLNEDVLNVLKLNVSDVIEGMMFEHYFYRVLSDIKFGKCGKCTKSGLPKCFKVECTSKDCKVLDKSTCNIYGDLKARLKSICINSDFKELLYATRKEF